MFCFQSLFAFISVIILFWSSCAFAVDVTPLFTEPSTLEPHVHATRPGSLTVYVDLQTSGTMPPDTFLEARVYNGFGDQVLGPLIISPNTATPIDLPGDNPAHYDFQFAPTGVHADQVAFPPQNPGFPSSMFGITITDFDFTLKPFNPDSRTGLVHYGHDDYYLSAIYQKTLTTRSSSTPAGLAAKIVSREAEANRKELLLISGSHFDWDPNNTGDEDPTSPVSQQFLDELKARIRAIIDELKLLNYPEMRYFQADVETNAPSNWHTTGYYVANYVAKVRAIQEAFSEEGWNNTQIIMHLRAWGSSNRDEIAGLLAFLQQDPIPNVNLGMSIYHWNASTNADFPPIPDQDGYPGEHGWFMYGMQEILSIMDYYSFANMPWSIMEIGIPIAKPTDPSTFHGYIRLDGSEVPTRRIDGPEAARYFSHGAVVSDILGMETTIWYNGHDRSNTRLGYPEEEFGTREYQDGSGWEDEKGFTKPTYAAYLMYVNTLNYADYVSFSKDSNTGAWRVEYRMQNNPSKGVIYSFIYPEPPTPQNISLDFLLPGLTPGEVSDVRDMFGGTMNYNGEAYVTSDGNPFYLMFDQSQSGSSPSPTPSASTTPSSSPSSSPSITPSSSPSSSPSDTPSSSPTPSPSATPSLSPSSSPSTTPSPTPSPSASNSPTPSPNDPPTVDAGVDQEITLPQLTTQLDGSVSDDGLPNPPGQVTTFWSLVSGPGNAQATFSDPASLASTVTFTRHGRFTLQLEANDGELVSMDTVVITVKRK